MLQSGDVLYIYCKFVKPTPKHKYVVCVSPQYPLFFLINTEPRKISPEAQVLVKASELPFLKYDSYINTAMLCTFSLNEIQRAQKKGVLTHPIIESIKSAVTKQKYLTQKQIELVLNNLPAKSS